MASAALIAFALQQDAVQFTFQPKVGEKYRFALTMEDEAGKPALPEGTKAYNIFKVAGVKEGKYTVHQTIEVTPFGSETQSAPFGSYRIDAQGNTEIIATAEELTPAGDGEAASTIMNGCFGIIFSPTPVKVGEEYQAPLDLIPAIKKYLPAVPPESKPVFEGTNVRKFILEKLDAKIGFFKSQIDCVIDISGEDASGRRQVHMEQKCAQATTVDRATGMPIKIDRKYSMVIKSGGKSNSIAGTVHLTRAN